MGATYRETLEAAIFSVKSDENASRMRCSFPPNFANFNRPVATIVQHPIAVAAACMTVSNHGALTFRIVSFVLGEWLFNS